MEIRLRVDRPLIIVIDNKEFFIDIKGNLSRNVNSSYVVRKEDIKEFLQYISNYSLYAYEEELRQGFITIKGGHRVGVAGRVVLENGCVKTIQNITYVNVRIAHEVIGCANKVMKYIYDIENKSIYNTLIISPPCCGKTTLLRDIIRYISNGDDEISGLTVGVVDERSEIAACYKGVAQNNVGIRTDILDCCTKDVGIRMLLRSMSPRVIAVDEIGIKKDLEAIENSVNCGCKILATVHGNDIEDKYSNLGILNKLYEMDIFKRYIVLSNKDEIGQVVRIMDKEKNVIM